jgi:2-polyprenyl-6-methoxyphenol hydroxylase-like FAD-dependent oxidoreductase
MLSRRGIEVDVYERAPELEEWSPRSYALNINERGQAALRSAGVLEAFTEQCTTPRNAVVIHLADGTEQV